MVDGLDRRDGYRWSQLWETTATLYSAGDRAMNESPFMLTAKDDDLLGGSNRSDAMGVPAV